MKYKRLKDLREDHDLTQAKLAENIGLYTTTYVRYEHGERELPLDIAVALAKFYNVSLDYIAGLTTTPKPLYNTPTGNKSVKITNKGDNNKFNIKQ